MFGGWPAHPAAVPIAAEVLETISADAWGMLTEKEREIPRTSPAEREERPC